MLKELPMYTEIYNLTVSTKPCKSLSVVYEMMEGQLLKN